ncbi:MAG: hypothetical protein WBD02_08145 [Acidimicrobiia bacterium]
MDCPKCKTLVEKNAPQCWMCHSPLAWDGGAPVVTGPPQMEVRDSAAAQARSAAAARTNRLAGLMVLALVLLAIGGALAYRAFTDNAEKVTRDARGFVIETVNGVKLTFPDRTQARGIDANGTHGDARLLQRSGAKREMLFAIVIDLPPGSDLTDLANPELASALVKQMSGYPGATATTVNPFKVGKLAFIDLSGGYDAKGTPVVYSMRIVAGRGKAVILAGAGSAGMPKGWEQLRDEMRFPS